ncbi:MAG: DUF2079 domain-containing protein [Candidatus Omnitrophica bacterium]|nr:DUF2079 domain-containing protein [Candidatus Omnitrophota bacterium]
MPNSSPKLKSFSKFVSFDRYDFLAFTFCIGLFVFWAQLLVEKFLHFGYYDWDLAIYANAMWALSHGSFNGSLWGTNFLTNHAEYIALLLTPLYKVIPSPFTLVTLKLLSMVAGGFILYLIAKDKLGWIFAIILMIFYLTFPANSFMLIYEFHFESLAIIFIFLVYYYQHTRPHYGKFIFYCILASLCKENIPVVIFMFGVMSFFPKKRPFRKYAWTAMVIGASIFILSIFIITPLLRSQEGMSTLNNPYVGLYWTNSNQLFIQNIIDNIHRLSSLILSSWNREYIQNLFFPFAFIPIFGLKTLLIGSPLFLQATLSNTYNMHTIYFHYAATLTPFLFLATIEGLSWTRNKPKWISFLFAIALLISMTMSFKSNLPILKNRIEHWFDSKDPIRQNMLSQIPPSASVVTTFEFLDQLANRDNIYAFRNVWQNSNQFLTHSGFKLPDVSYALIDWDCPWLLGDLFNSKKENSQQYLQRIHDFYFSRSWETISAVEEITLLSKTLTNEPKPPLVENLQTPFTNEILTKNILEIGDHINFINLNISHNPDTPLNILPLEFIWQSRKETDDFLLTIIRIVKDNRVILNKEHILGYAFNSTPLWKKEQYVRENYYLSIPRLTPGEYQINISVFNLSQKKYEDLRNSKNKTYNNLNVLTFTVKQ